MSRHPNRAQDAAQDMLRGCLKIERLLSGMSEAEFLGDEATCDRVILAIAIIGEASKRFMDAVPGWAVRFPTIPFAGMYSMRNRVIHGYDVINYVRVWETASNSLPPFVVFLENLLANWPSDLT